MFKKMLNELDQWLGEKNRRLTLHLIGGYALELKNIQRGFATEDIDPLNQIEDDEIKDKIHEIGEKYGNSKWIDFGASSLISPTGYESRMEPTGNFDNIDLYLLSNADIIKMKVAAYHSRRERGIYRDLEDLKKLKPTSKEVDEAVDFYFNNYSKDLTGKFLKDFKDEVEDLRKELKDLLC